MLYKLVSKSLISMNKFSFEMKKKTGRWDNVQSIFHSQWVCVIQSSTDCDIVRSIISFVDLMTTFVFSEKVSLLNNLEFRGKIYSYSIKLRFKQT